MATLDKSPAYFNGDTFAPQKSLLPHYYDTIERDGPVPVGRDVARRWYCQQQHSRDEPRKPKAVRRGGLCEATALLTLKRSSITNGYDAVREGDERRPASRALYYIKAADSEAGGEVSSVIYTQTSSVVAATTDAS